MNLSRNADVKELNIKSVEGKTLHGEVVMKPLIAGDQMTLLEIQYPPGAGAPLHVHQHETLAYVIKGKVKMTVGKAEYVLGPGDVCRHPQGIPHGVEGVEQALVLEIKSPAQPIAHFLGTSQR
ncbi:MAG: cupin domain-containing protein [Candidatus Binatia bacterium]